MIRARVRDNDTGHEYDLPLERAAVLVERGAVVEIQGERHEGRRPRPPKHFTPPLPPLLAAPKTTRPKAVAEPTVSTRDRSAES